jgi:polyhydroxyalkanoate synthase subunit PhaE
MNDSNPWAEQWLNAQQKFVETWGQMAKDGQPANSQTNLWSEGLKLWTDSFQPQESGFKQAVDKCFDAGKSYFSMTEQVSNLMADGKSATEAMTQWTEQLKSSLQAGIMSNPMAGAMGGFNPGSFNPGSFNPSTNDFMQQWFAPAKNWENMVSNMNMFSQNPMQMPGMNGAAFNMGEMVDPLGKALSAPGIGYFREPQEKQQKGIQLMLEYHQANNDFNQASLRISIESVQGFQDRLVKSTSENSPKSMRDLYDLWVEVSEEHYAVFAMSEEYQTLYGAMVNKLMSTKKHYQGITNDLMESMNMPSRQEVDTLQYRLAEVRRENRGLRNQIAEINSKLDALASQPAPAPVVVEKEIKPAKPTKPAKLSAETEKPAAETVKKPVAKKKAVSKKKAASKSGDKA